MRASFWTVRGDLCRSSPSEHHLTHVSDSGFQLESPVSSDHTMSGNPAALQHIIQRENPHKNNFSTLPLIYKERQAYGIIIFTCLSLSQ